MDQEDEELARELRSLLPQNGFRTAFGDEAEAQHGEEEADSFFTAISAFRAARASGDKEAEAAAEERLRTAVRNELIQNGC